MIRVNKIDLDQPVPTFGLGHLVEIIKRRLSFATQVGDSTNMRLQCIVRHRNIQIKLLCIASVSFGGC
jgi:hypothetical protein